LGSFAAKRVFQFLRCNPRGGKSVYLHAPWLCPNQKKEGKGRTGGNGCEKRNEGFLGGKKLEVPDVRGQVGKLGTGRQAGKGDPNRGKESIENAHW